MCPHEKAQKGAAAAAAVAVSAVARHKRIICRRVAHAHARFGPTMFNAILSLSCAPAAVAGAAAAAAAVVAALRILFV